MDDQEKTTTTTEDTAAEDKTEEVKEGEGEKESTEKVDTKTKDKEEEIDLDTIEPETRTKAEIKADDKKEKEADDPDLDPEDEKRISKVLDKRLGGYEAKLARVQKLENEAEVNGFLSGKPEFTKYKATILKYMDHPSYSNIPAHNIAAIVASKDLMKMGAQKEREAAKQAKDTQTPGNTARKEATMKDWGSASKEDYEAQRAKVLGYQG